VLEDPVWAEAAPWLPPPGAAPLVLGALSSTFQNQAACLQHVADALATLPVRGVITTGPAIDPATLSAPGNVSVMATAPHREILRHAALVVTHGGHGTVIKALAAGVPLVMLPHGRDQSDTAARVVARAAGIAIARTATAQTIAETIRRVLEQESSRDSARRLGDMIRRDANSEALIRELEELPVLSISRPAHPLEPAIARRRLGR
jgi:MGT family glycosyltransferase